MCGIAGIISATPRADLAEKAKALVGALSHRGRDDQGLYTGDHVAIAHKRLSIIDLEGGHQPIVSDNGNVIAINGMIYNYLELKDRLKGARFKTDSDSEVPLKAYEQFGETFTEHLRGMYALAIYDAAQDKLYLSRDPYGIKPLYYTQGEGEFMFASEPQAFFKSGLLTAQTNPAKAAELLQLKFTTGRETIFSGVNRVLPGETICVSGGRIVGRERCDPFASLDTPDIDEAAAGEKLAELLAESVSLHTRSDVPYGVFLSGGVDSCAVVAALSQSGFKGYTCYTAHFPGSDLYDETHIAADVARAAGARHEKVAISEEDFWETLPQVIRHVDDPTQDAAMIANFILARKASGEGIKVVLGGDGGDEVFAGYRRYERTNLPGFLEYPMRKHGLFSGSGLMQKTSAHWRDDYAEIARDCGEKTYTRLQKLQALDGSDFLPHFNLMKLDRCLMAHHIEGRTPLLDQRLSPFGFNLPDRVKLKKDKGKWLLRNWLQQAMPEAQPFLDKRGFSFPANQWIAAKAPDWADFVCDQAGVREMFKIDRVQKLFSGGGGRKAKLRWPILYYALWHETHICGRPLA